VGGGWWWVFIGLGWVGWESLDTVRVGAIVLGREKEGRPCLY